MSKKTDDKPTADTASAVASETSTASHEGAVQPDLAKPVVQEAIASGRKVISDGGTKADAARAMYESISGESKETVVAAFVEGASLTPKGALTYWYNCKRKASKKASTT